MNHIRRIAAALARLACACLGLAITATAAFAQAPGPPRSENMPAVLLREALLRGEDLAPASGSGSVPSLEPLTVTRTVMVGGMPGWQIALIAVVAALLTARMAVLADRARAVHGRLLELGETPEDGLARDLLEQTGIRLRAERPARKSVVRKSGVKASLRAWIGDRVCWRGFSRCAAYCSCRGSGC